MPPGPFRLPEISKEDVAWAARILELPDGAFSGANGQDPRESVLRSVQSLDVEACPGSGKTTLLVAKLAILARRWVDTRRGICVLSHTNAARREIEERVERVSDIRSLLSYPHFIGTIHGFANEFLALPWLRSKGIPISRIDDSIALERRWRRLPRRSQFVLEKSGLTQRGLEFLRVVTTNFDIAPIPWGRGTLGSETETFRDVASSCRATCEEGYFCFDEMFLFAEEALANGPGVVRAIRNRFPLLFIDEVQDNSEPQSAMLFHAFVDGPDGVVRQRFGDSNQAIFRSHTQESGASTDGFPNPALRKSIPNSYRFGQEIADRANPFAPVPQNLVGLGPCLLGGHGSAGRPGAIFLFEDASVTAVLPAYCQYLLKVFSDEELAVGTFAAVAAVHRALGDDRVPRHLGHYWPAYSPALAAPEPRPDRFLHFLNTGLRDFRAAGDAYWLTDRIGQGFSQLVRLLRTDGMRTGVRGRHREIVESLESRPSLKVRYIALVARLLAAARLPSKAIWESELRPGLLSLAQAVAEVDYEEFETSEFLAWPADSDWSQLENCDRHPGNQIRYPEEQPKVVVRLGSIHSVKGETHTGTLVLESFHYDHLLNSMKSHLLDPSRANARQSTRYRMRLRQHYVAMTRPSHLLCLAMREGAFDGAEIQALCRRRWRVGRVNASGVSWLGVLE